MPKGGQLIIKTDNVTADQVKNQTKSQKTSRNYVQITITDTGYDVNAEIDEMSHSVQAPITVLQKPYTKEILSQTVRELLDR